MTTRSRKSKCKIKSALSIASLFTSNTALTIAAPSLLFLSFNCSAADIASYNLSGYSLGMTTYEATEAMKTEYGEGKINDHLIVGNHENHLKESIKIETRVVQVKSFNRSDFESQSLKITTNPFYPNQIISIERSTRFLKDDFPSFAHVYSKMLEEYGNPIRVLDITQALPDHAMANVVTMVWSHDVQAPKYIPDWNPDSFEMMCGTVNPYVKKNFSDVDDFVTCTVFLRAENKPMTVDRIDCCVGSGERYEIAKQSVIKTLLDATHASMEESRIQSPNAKP